MNSEDSQDSSWAFSALVFVLLALLVFKKVSSLKPVVIHWIDSHRWVASGLAAAAILGLASVVYGTLQILDDNRKRKKYVASITAWTPGSTYAGRSGNGEAVFIPIEARRMHTQVIGTTNAGKSESVIIPWAIGDMKDNRGFVVVDGKADSSFIQKLYSYAKKLKRTDDFKVFSLQDPNRSHTFNPLLGGTPEEVAERVFNSFEFDNSYYESIQYEVFAQTLRIFDRANMKPTFLRIYQALKGPAALYDMALISEDENLIRWVSGFKSLSPSDRDERTSGLLASLSHFAFGAHAKLFNTDSPDIDLNKVLVEGELIYFQLPVLKAAFLGKATGKLVLQCLQGAIANRHGDETGKEQSFFSIYLDDFTEYLYPGFVSLLNKSRSANVGVVFAHQALGDIKALGEDVATSILTNSNLKIIMRGNDPDSAEYFSKVIGTTSGEKMTERAETGIFGNSRTGQGSIRDVEEFLVHPNVIKRNMGVGEALVIVPHKLGTKTLKVKFAMMPSLAKSDLPTPSEKPVLGLDAKSGVTPATNKSNSAGSTELAFTNEKSQPKDAA